MKFEVGDVVEVMTDFSYCGLPPGSVRIIKEIRDEGTHTWIGVECKYSNNTRVSKGGSNFGAESFKLVSDIFRGEI